jgi:hypothetical protein
MWPALAVLLSPGPELGLFAATHTELPVPENAFPPPPSSACTPAYRLPASCTPLLLLCPMSTCRTDLARGQALCVDCHRRAPSPQGAVCVHPQLHQPIHQVLDWALPHALDTIQHKPVEAHAGTNRKQCHCPFAADRFHLSTMPCSEVPRGRPALACCCTHAACAAVSSCFPECCQRSACSLGAAVPLLECNQKGWHVLLLTLLTAPRQPRLTCPCLLLQQLLSGGAWLSLHSQGTAPRLLRGSARHSPVGSSSREV